MSKNVIIIGGGIAGMESAAYLAAMGYNVTILEKEGRLGGNLLKWERLFPTKRMGSEVLEFLSQGVSEDVSIIYHADIEKIDKKDKTFIVHLSKGASLRADALLIATGFDTFPAEKKEEYGYGIYNNVITSPDLESLFLSGKEIKTASGKKPHRIGFVHCVGSRDEKVGNIYCSKVCCVTGVKQSIEIKEKFPQSEVYCFYMDMRMYGVNFEELYKEAQEKWEFYFIRGRLSEACENADGSIVVKVEDTLAGKPLKMTVDLLVLLVGFVPSEGTKKIGQMLNLELDSNRFLKPADEHTMTNVSSIPGIFLAGTCTSPRTITNTIMDARSAAATVASYLEGYDIEKRVRNKI